MCFCDLKIFSPILGYVYKYYVICIYTFWAGRAKLVPVLTS